MRDYIVKDVHKIVEKYGTRNPFQLCECLGVDIYNHNLGCSIKAYYFRFSRHVRSIVLNSMLPEEAKFVLTAHEIGHDRLHIETGAFKEHKILDINTSCEYEANLFAAELLMEDDEVFGLIQDETKTFFGIASELLVPPEFLDFKLRIMESNGYPVASPRFSAGDFLKHKNSAHFPVEKVLR